jgi:hypothetical protein
MTTFKVKKTLPYKFEDLLNQMLKNQYIIHTWRFDENGAIHAIFQKN